MRRLLGWLDKHLLEIGVAAFLVFIPLYPKFPLIDVPHTWVYIRLEDFLVALITALWLFQLGRRRVSLKIPLTLPILFYWLAGGISLLFCLIFLRVHLANFAPNVAVLHYFRRIEYMVVFLIAFSTIKDLKIVKKYLLALALAIIGVSLYGFGQKFLGWPAFLTMNEEFAKGLPLYLPPTARVVSTFGGHYDLAAWLVLMIALWGSLIFGLKNRLWRLGALLLVFVSFVLLLFTASRISFVAYLLAISLVLFLQRKKWLIVPVVIVSLLLMNYVTGASQRFGKTFRVERVVYDTKTGQPIAALEKEEEIGRVITEEEEMTSEDLPLGTGYVSLPRVFEKGVPEATQVAVIKRPIVTSLKTATKASEIATISGEFLIKRAIVYDISFTTRFQGTWPRALKAFRRNLLLGTGYSSIGLATDNSYLRALGETGLLGFLAFISVLFGFFLLVKQGLAEITLPLARSILIGVAAGLVGLVFNAILIDVFEASKVAFTLWAILGITVGVINFYLPRKKDLIKEMVEVVNLPMVSIIILVMVALFIFSTGLNNYFVGDDFTWLRWAAKAKMADLTQFFLSAEGFFYRPLAKVYFFLINPFFGLRPQGYHLVDFFLHFACTTAVYLLGLKLTKKRPIALLVGLLFLLHPTGAETVLWISSTSSLFASFFYLWGFLAYLQWRESQKKWCSLFFLLTCLAFILGLASHELMVTFPLMIIFADWVFGQLKRKKRWLLNLAAYLPFGILLDLYLWVRNVVAQAHGLSGDYNYNLKNLPFNFAGNLLGYLGELTVSFHFLPLYDWLRIYFRSQKLLTLGLLLIGFLIMVKVLRRIRLSKAVLFSLGWFLIPLLPFLGLGNLAERNVYLARLGFFVLLALAINWLYEKLKRKNLELGIYLMILVMVFILTFYGWEMEKTKQDWYQAGEVANKILLALSSNYEDFPSGSTLYFVNLPIRQNRAWVFPVGIKDGIWFVYRDESLTINITTDLEETLDLAEGKPYNYVFLYEDGKLKKATR